MGQMHLLALLQPKGPRTWAGFWILLVALVIQIGPALGHPAGFFVGALFAGGFVFAAVRIPNRVLHQWTCQPPWLRSVGHGVIIYTVIVTLGFANEIRSPRAWVELLTVSGGAPFSFTHTLAWCAVALSTAIQLCTVPGAVPFSGEPDRLVRGPKLITEQEARTRAAGRRSPQPPGERGFLWGGMELPFWRGTEHFCIIGESGAGKSKTIQLQLKSVLPTIVPGSNRRAILYDAKRDLYSKIASFGITCPVQLLHPFDRRGWAWDIAKDVTDPLVAIEIATILIPEKLHENQPFFPNAARALLSGVMEVLLRTAPGKWTLRDVVLTLRYSRRTKTLLHTSSNTRYLADKYVGENRTEKDIASTVENAMRRLSFIAAAWEMAGDKRISLEEWVERGESVLLLGRSPKMESTFTELNRAILFRLAQLIRDQADADRDPAGRPPRQTWIVVDELREAGKLDGFNSLLVEGRSKGACVVLGFQDIPGLHSVYGRELADELIGLCANKAFLRTGDPSTQQFASNCVGTQDVDMRRVSTSFSQSVTSARESSSSESAGTQVSEQRVTRPVILPSQFAESLPRPNREVGLHGVFLTAAVGQPYFGHTPGDLLQRELPDLDYSRLSADQQDFVPRMTAGGEMLTLKEWTEEDLRRLNLQNHPALLETDADKATPDGGWLGVMPNQ